MTDLERRKDLVDRREMLRRMGSFSAVAASILAGGSALTACGGGGGGGGGGGSGDGGSTAGQTMATAIPMNVGDVRTLVLQGDGPTVMWFKVTCPGNVSEEAIVRVDTCDTGSAGVTCRIYASDGTMVTSEDAYAGYEVHLTDWSCTSDPYGYVQFELNTGEVGASIGFSTHDVDAPSWTNSYSDWTNSYSDWSNSYSDWSNGWHHAYSDWSNLWTNWVNSW